MKTKDYLFTSESVTEGHPDKIADAISDNILDECLKQDKDSRVACEVLVTTGLVVVAGEITTKGYVDVRKVVTDTIENIGYDDGSIGFDYRSVGVLSSLNRQSQDISQGVTKGQGLFKEQGAGDQGVVLNAAINETDELMPCPIVFAHRLTRGLATARKNGLLPFLRPDGKSQVTVKYIDDKPVAIDTVVVSSQHSPDVQYHVLKESIIEEIIKKELPLEMLIDTKYFINPTGRFVVGGPMGDAGVTNRKLCVDSSGSFFRHGGGGWCVDSETEYLTPIGWKHISKYKKGELVAQYKENGDIEFINPDKYIKVSAENMYHITKNNAINQVLSGGHNFVYISSKGNLNKKPFNDIKEMHNNSLKGFSGRIITSFNYNGGTGINMSDDELRLQIAAMADGSYKNKTTKLCRFRLKKEGKINRLQNLIKKLKLESNDRTVNCDEFRYITVETPRNEKHFTSEYWNANLHQLKVIADEVFYWDGDIKEQKYRTTNKNDADFIQYVLTSVFNKRVSISIDDRIGEEYHNGYERKSLCYEVYVCNHSLVGLCGRKSGDNYVDKASIVKYEPIDGKQYCFTVPSGMLVLRRDNKIFITGNSGKDPSKVDRSAAYYARYMAKNIVAAQIASKCEVQLGYAIGVAKPVSLFIDTFGTSKYDNDIIVKAVNEVFDARPANIIEELDLLRPIYHHTTNYGHIGKCDCDECEKIFTWERLDKVEQLKDAIKVLA